MQKKLLSNGLYQALPWLYAGVGVLTLSALRNPLGLLSGLTLLGVAAIVWALRKRHRLSWRLDEPPRRESAAAASAHLPPLEWRSNFCSGDATIDAQHNHLFDLGNEFICAGGRHRPLAELVRLVEELLDQLSRHLRVEERLLAQAGHKLSQQDRESQSRLLSRATLLKERFRKGLVLFPDMAAFVVDVLVVNHVVKQGSNRAHGA